MILEEVKNNGFFGQDYKLCSMSGELTLVSVRSLKLSNVGAGLTAIIDCLVAAMRIVSPSLRTHPDGRTPVHVFRFMNYETQK